MSDDPTPTLNDALRSLARAGSADSPAARNLQKRWEETGSLSLKQLAEDPAFQRDPAASLTAWGGSITEALWNYHETRRRMTARPTRKDQP